MVACLSSTSICTQNLRPSSSGKEISQCHCREMASSLAQRTLLWRCWGCQSRVALLQDGIAAGLAEYEATLLSSAKCLGRIRMISWFASLTILPSRSTPFSTRDRLDRGPRVSTSRCSIYPASGMCVVSWLVISPRASLGRR